jgi:hypothetical protein
MLDEGQISMVGTLLVGNTTWLEVGGARKFASVDGFMRVSLRDPFLMQESAGLGELAYDLQHTLH